MAGSRLLGKSRRQETSHSPVFLGSSPRASCRKLVQERWLAPKDFYKGVFGGEGVVWSCFVLSLYI
jgi:hypothetical protein